MVERFRINGISMILPLEPTLQVTALQPLVPIFIASLPTPERPATPLALQPVALIAAPLVIFGFLTVVARVPLQHHLQQVQQAAFIVELEIQNQTTTPLVLPPVQVVRYLIYGF
jgi:hypothetical protein